MAKILETVDKCNSCKHIECLDSQKKSVCVDFCHLSNKVIRTYNHNSDNYVDITEIPEWCPLPDAPEK